MQWYANRAEIERSSYFPSPQHLRDIASMTTSQHVLVTFAADVLGVCAERRQTVYPLAGAESAVAPARS